MKSKLDWVDIGEVVTTDARPRLAHIPSVPGIYRIISIDGWCYVGQAKDIRHRMYGYHRPTLDNEHEHRLHRLFRAHPSRIEISTGERMTSGSTRKLLEAEAMLEAKASGLRLGNLSQNYTAMRIQMRIDYHQLMLEEPQELLSRVGAK